MKKQLLFGTLLTALAASASAQVVNNANATLAHSFSLGTPATWFAPANQPIYSDITTFTGFGGATGGAALVGNNTSTPMNADDITPIGGFAGQAVTQFTFSTANFNTVAVKVAPHVTIWDNANAGNPGNWLATFNFNPVTLNAGTVNLFNFSPTTLNVPLTSTFWAGISFDDNGGTTGVTLAQLNSVGQGIFNPPTVGSSADLWFKTTATGNGMGVNNPAGGLFFFGGSPVANFGWQFQVAAVPEPTSVAILGLGALGLIVRRRRRSSK